MQNLEENIIKNNAKILAYAAINGIIYDFFVRIRNAELHLLNAGYSEDEAKEVVFQRAHSAVSESEIRLMRWRYMVEDENHSQEGT